MTELDRAALAAYCAAYGRWAQAERAINRMAAKDELNAALMIKPSAAMPYKTRSSGSQNKAGRHGALRRRVRYDPSARPASQRHLMTRLQKTAPPAS